MACAASVFLLTQHFFCYTCILTDVVVHRQAHVKRVLGKLSVFLNQEHYIISQLPPAFAVPAPRSCTSPSCFSRASCAQSASACTCPNALTNFRIHQC